MSINKLEVFFRENKVGTLVLTKNKEIAFQYDKKWIEKGFSISPFSLPLTNQIFINRKQYFHGLFGVFNDSFVDSWGELLIQRYLRKEGLDYNNLNILDKLSIIGSSTMGGLTYFPCKDIKIYMNNKSIDEIQIEINKLLNNKNINDIDTLFSLGGSSGGTRPKILTDIDGKHVIVKFKTKSDPFDIGLKEYLYCVYASKLGIDVPYVNLIKGKENDYFTIERFDVENDKRKFIISVSGLLECDYNSPSLDYLDLIKLTNILTRDKKDILEMYRRMVFNVVFDNLDDHSKNFSFMFDEEKKKYILASAYDLTPSSTFYGEHTTSVNHKGKDITKEDMLEVAKKSNINVKIAEDIIENAYRLKTEYMSEIKKENIR